MVQVSGKKVHEIHGDFGLETKNLILGTYRVTGRVYIFKDKQKEFLKVIGPLEFDIVPK